jgi:hypothetical protein
MVVFLLGDHYYYGLFGDQVLTSSNLKIIPRLQIINHSSFSKCIDFIIYLDILYIEVQSEKSQNNLQFKWNELQTSIQTELLSAY